MDIPLATWVPARARWARSVTGLAFVLAFVFAGCVGSPEAEAPPDWLAWRERRHESIAGPEGWLTLAGLHWLREGENTVGSDPGHPVVLPAGKAPLTVGILIRSGSKVRFRANPGVDVTVEGVSVGEMDMDLVSDASLTPTKLRVGGLTFWVLDRGDRMGVRVRDPESVARREFAGLECFPYDPAWRIPGRFEPHGEAKVVRVRDVTGATQDTRVVGDLVFAHQGVEHRLPAVEEPGEEDFFVIFRDRTAGGTTYGAGRYLYVARPISGSSVVLDFNRAYTPPCGFTPYATCPLPPRGSWLPFEVRAGERTPPGHP
ncbi:MAG: DUF1684 domain-containing protein [Limisphaerales bacterium]